VPSHGSCRFQQQKIDARNADVVILSSELAFHDIDKLNIGKFGLVVFDESWWKTGLKTHQKIKMARFTESIVQFPPMQGVGARYDMTTFKKIRRKKGEPPREKQIDLGARNRLLEAGRQLEALFDESQPYELLSRDLLTRHRFFGGPCHKLVIDEWARKVTPNIHAGMPLTDMRKQARGVAANNAAVENRAAWWHEKAIFLDGDQPASGRLQIGEKRDDKGNRGFLLLHERRGISATIRDLPIIYADATMPDDSITREYLPRFQRLADINAATPFVTIMQITGAWGKHRLVPLDTAASAAASNADSETEGDDDGDEETGDDDTDPVTIASMQTKNKRRLDKLSEIRDFISSRTQGEPVVLITYQALEPYFQGIPGLKVIHWNNFSGSDEHRHVRWLIILGQPTATHSEVGVLYRAVTGRAVPSQEMKFINQFVNMADGSARSMRTAVYADPGLEAIRVAITNSAVSQGFGRPRGTNRTAETPCNVILMTNVVMPYPLSALVAWEDVALPKAARMAARGLFLNSPRDAALVYDDLFVSEDAAWEALDGVVLLRPLISPCIPRSLKNISSNLLGLHGEINGRNDSTTDPVFRLKSANYQPKGAGQQRRFGVWVAPQRAASLEAELTAKLGPLARFQVSDELTFVKIQLADPKNQPSQSAPARPVAPAGSPQGFAGGTVQ
jgi:hypothetical protein